MPRRPSSLRVAIGIIVAISAGFGLLLATAAPAAADGARPTSYESVLDQVTPAVDGAKVEVLGGDAFLQVTTRPGTEVQIPGYDGEPYLRIRRNGAVEVNLRAPAYWLNQGRSGTQRLPASASSTSAPEWHRTGAVGTVACHDHRIHWMMAERPTTSAGGLVQDWFVPMTVNGRAVKAEGQLLYRGRTVSPVELLLLILTVAGAAVALGRWARRPPQQLLGLFTSSAIALTVAWCSFRASPPSAGASLLPVIVAGFAMLVVAAAPGLPKLPLPLAAAATLIGWAVVRSQVMWSPVVPTTLPGWIDRFGTALVLGAAAGVAFRLVRPAGASDDRALADV